MRTHTGLFAGRRTVYAGILLRKTCRRRFLVVKPDASKESGRIRLPAGTAAGSICADGAPDHIRPRDLSCQNFIALLHHNIHLSKTGFRGLFSCCSFRVFLLLSITTKEGSHNRKCDCLLLNLFIPPVRPSSGRFRFSPRRLRRSSGNHPAWRSPYIRCSPTFPSAPGPFPDFRNLLRRRPPPA